MELIGTFWKKCVVSLVLLPGIHSWYLLREEPDGRLEVSKYVSSTFLQCPDFVAWPLRSVFLLSHCCSFLLIIGNATGRRKPRGERSRCNSHSASTQTDLLFSFLMLSGSYFKGIGKTTRCSAFNMKQWAEHWSWRSLFTTSSDPGFPSFHISPISSALDMALGLLFLWVLGLFCSKG